MARKRRVVDIEKPIRKPHYKDGDKVWVLWANYYYRGKVMKRGIDHYYYVHFWKYSKSWDRPLPVTRIIPTLPENDKWVKKHNDLIKAPINAKKKILRQIAKYKGKSVKETPPFITICKVDLSKYKMYSSEPATSTYNEVDHSLVEGNYLINNDIINSVACATTVSLNGLENTKNTVNINTIDQESYVTAEGDLSIKNASTSSFSDESNDEKIIPEAFIMSDGSIHKIKRDSEDIDYPVNNDDPGITNYDQGLDELNQNSNGTAPVPSFMPGIRLKPFANIQHAWTSSSDGNDCADESLLPMNDHNDTESNVEITIFGSEGHIATIDVRFDPRFNILSSIEGNQNLEDLNESPMEVESKCDDFETNSSECLTVATATQSSDMISDDIDIKTDLNTDTRTFISLKLDTNNDNLPASSAVPDFVCNKSVDLSNEAGSQSMQSNEETQSLCDQVTTSTHAEQLNPSLTSLKDNSIADNSNGLNNEASLLLIDLNEGTHDLCDQVTTSTHEEELNPNDQQHFISLNENSMADDLSDVLTDHEASLSSMNSKGTHNVCDYVTTSTQVEKLNSNDQQLSISLKDNTIAKNSIDVINEAGSSSIHSNEDYHLYDQVSTSIDEDQLNPNDDQNLTSLKEIADNSSDLAVDDASMSSMIVTESNDENRMVNIAGCSTQGNLAIDEASTLSMIVTESYEENRSMINEASESTQGDLVLDDASMSSMIVAESNDESSCLMNVADGSTQGDLAIDDASMSSIMVTESNDEERLLNISSRTTQGDLVIDDASTSSIIVTESNDESCLMNIANGSTQGDKSSHCTNENWSSPCSSTSVRYYEDNDGQTLDDDEQYVKTRKVSKKRVKLDDEDRKIYKKFAYDKQYSRAAKVKATEAISQMSKPPINKEKKSDVGKRPKNAGKKKDDDESSILIKNLSHYNINTNNCLKQIFIEDRHLLIDMRLVTKLPARTSVLDILTEYASNFNAQESSGFKHCLHIFNHLIDSVLLYSLELQNHSKYIKNNPGVTNAQIYGLPHLVRFIYHLPMVFYAFKDSEEILPKLIQFIQRLPEYMEEKQMRLPPYIYDNTTPDYVRVSYYGVD